jgi:oligosaccharide 4-alpha-D-glucosyltransferase
MYTCNILKINFLPKGYERNEQITGAIQESEQPHKTRSWQVNKVGVKQRPRTISMSPYKIQCWGDSICISLGDKSWRCSYAFASNVEHGYNFQLKPGERIFGGGERAIPLNRRGYHLPLYNQPRYAYAEGADVLNYSIPFLTSSYKYGLFFDNAAKSSFDIGKEDEALLQYRTCSGALDVYLIPGKSYAEILQNYHHLTGTQPLLPRWTLGGLMSRFGYTSETQVKGIIEKMKAEKIPFDAVIFDLFWFGDSIKGTLGNLDWINKEKWPDPAAMMADFKKDSIKTVLVTEPFVLETSKTYCSFLPYLAVDSSSQPYRLTNFYFGLGGLIDIFRTDARNHFWTYYKRQMQQGVDGWWGDLGEPETHPEDLFHRLSDMGKSRLFSSNEVHNIYGHYWTKMLFEKFKQDYPDRRLFSLNRSGFAGTQRYGIVPWTGDVSRTWSGLRAQLPVLLGMSMSGVPYVHSDAGGFAGGEGDWMLYLRWLQMAVFTPIFRPHGTALYEVDPAAYSFPSEIALAPSPYKENARESARLRYRMLPYNYSLSYEQTVSGSPLLAPLYYHFESDTNTYHIEDQYMWGPSIMVAPIVEKDMDKRKVYLPGGNWYAWMKNELMFGSTYIEEKVVNEAIPVFVKSGGIIPLLKAGTEISNTAAYNTNCIEWHYYLGSQTSEFTLFDDDGQSAGSLTKGQYDLVRFRVEPANDKLQISVSTAGKPYSGRLSQRQHIVYLHGLKGQWKKADESEKDVVLKLISPGLYQLEFCTSQATKNLVLVRQ